MSIAEQPPTPPPGRRLLAVHAHPDDETITMGGTLARYAADGAHVTLVTCTLGEEGEILVPELALLAAAEADQLGGYRIGELAAATAALGVTDSRFLGGPGRWRDSGMMGEPANARPRTFWGADLDGTDGPVRALVAVIREVRPQVLATYDENGGYGHPDHIQAHRVAMAAYTAAADPAYAPDAGEPWQIAKVYWTTLPRSVLRAGIEAVRAADVGFLPGAERAEDERLSVPDDVVTTAVDVRDQLPRKLLALRAHATQIAVDGPFYALTNNIGSEAVAVEHYRLVRGTAGPGDGPNGWETDLFAGLV